MTCYSTQEAADIVGVTFRHIDNWAREGVVVPSVRAAIGPGSRRRYSFDDLICLRTVAVLREFCSGSNRAGGCALSMLGPAVDQVRTACLRPFYWKWLTVRADGTANAWAQCPPMPPESLWMVVSLAAVRADVVAAGAVCD